MGSKKKSDVRYIAEPWSFCRLRPKFEMHGVESQKSAQSSKGDDSEATKAAAARRPGSNAIAAW